MRRDLLLKTGLYKTYPWTCIFFIEEVYNEYNSSDLKGCYDFEFGSSRNEIYIRYKLPNGKLIEEQTPISEIDGWVLPDYSKFTFLGFGMEEKLKKLYDVDSKG